jgi:hypothetical protein
MTLRDRSWKVTSLAGLCSAVCLAACARDAPPPRQAGTPTPLFESSVSTEDLSMGADEPGRVRDLAETTTYDTPATRAWEARVEDERAAPAATTLATTPESELCSRIEDVADLHVEDAPGAVLLVLDPKVDREATMRTAELLQSAVAGTGRVILELGSAGGCGMADLIRDVSLVSLTEHEKGIAVKIVPAHPDALEGLRARVRSFADDID